MPNYKQSDVAGTQWQRCNQLWINNPYNEVPTINMCEEVVVQAGTEVFKQPTTGMSFPFDPTEVIPLLHPETGEVLGETTGMDIYVALWSLYAKRAAERDT